MLDRLMPKGKFIVEIYRAKDGSIEKYTFPNGMTNLGRNNLLDVYFRQQANSTWYLGLIDTGASLAAGDTMGSHTGWTEATYYSEGTRGTWGPSAASAQSITNGTQVTFSINANGHTVFGIFVTSDNTKSGTSGNLWSTAGFSTPPAVNSGDIIKVTYTVND